MKSKNVLLIGHNFSPEPTGIGKYSGEMMDWFAKSGYNCTVVCTYPYYPYWKVQPPYKNRWYKKEVISYPESGTTMTIFRCPSYVPANPTGKKRIIQDFSFWTSMIWVVLKLILSKQKFDLVITIAPPFHLAYLGLWYKKIKGGKLVYHIQDLQIEAAQDLKLLSNDSIFKAFYKAEARILKKADVVSSISVGMIGKIEAKAKRKVLFFPNWADNNFFFPIPNREYLKSKWGYNVTDIVYLYSGAIGEKQGLENIISAADILRTHSNIKFIICGSGPYKENLIKMAESKALTNLKFLPTQSKEVFNEFLNMADVHLIIQKVSAGDLVMPSKLSTILAVGGASITTCLPQTTLYNVILENDLGYDVVPEDMQLLADKVLQVSQDEQIEIKRDNARRYAEKHLNLNNIMTAFTNTVFS
jgi:colanic acid biosynthesis glycosyl transferase WcaI